MPIQGQVQRYKVEDDHTRTNTTIQGQMRPYKTWTASLYMMEEQIQPHSVKRSDGNR